MKRWFDQAHFQVQVREIAKNFRVLRKYSNKFDCLIFEIFFFIRDLKPKLNKQSDSIPAKPFV